MSDLLLDTHALLWVFNDPAKLTDAARDAIGDPNHGVLVSAASVYELALKHGLGKLEQADLLLDDLERSLRANAFELLAVDHRHALAAGRLPMIHRDPFDRLLIAQAQVEGLTLVSNEALFDRYGVARLW